MDVKRIALLGVTGGAVVVWLASAATTTRPAVAPPIATRARVVELSGAELSAEISRLHDRLRPQAVPTENRDLFRYSSRRAAVAPAPAALDVAVEIPVPPPPPTFRLVGMADSVAIISGAGELLLVREGDAVTSQYRVITITPTTVDLRNVNDNSTLHLSLK
jgi:hypothetical protein